MKIFHKSLSILLIIAMAASMILLMGFSPASFFANEQAFRSAIAAGGTVTLNQDILLSSTIYINNTVRLTGNGTLRINCDFRHFTVNGGGNFTLDGDVTLLGNGPNIYGGGVNVVGWWMDPATFNMYGGTISNNRNPWGGGVAFLYGNTFNMYGGTISDNIATASGGGVGAGGVFRMHGGTISSNTSEYFGGGVHISADVALMNMTGGAVTNNISQRGGGISNWGRLYISQNAIVSNNIAHYIGGGVWTWWGRLEMSGGNISNNNAIYGGGVYMGDPDVTATSDLHERNTFVMNGGTISHNTSIFGGGMFLYFSTLTMNGGTISNNTASVGGGGIFTSHYQFLQTSNASVFYGNTAAQSQNHGVSNTTWPNIRWASVSLPATHVLNNYDINYPPGDSGWFFVNDQWFFYINGMRHVGWLNIGGTWYYMQPSGAMATGWILNDGIWYFFRSNGAMATGWLYGGGVWYLLLSSGAMATGWANDGGTWYFFNSCGAMHTGWVLDGYDWYFLHPSGAMATGWVNCGGIWYFMHPSGAMAVGWVNDGGTWYYLRPCGAMATDQLQTTGYGMQYFDSSGAWVGAY